MKEFNIAGHKFKCEKLHEDQYKKGACAFKIIDDDGKESYWVVIPSSMSGFTDGNGIATPNEGHVVAFCVNEQDALMVASSINIAANVVSLSTKAESAFVEKAASELGFDIDALRAEVNRLKAEGKSAKEVLEILKPRMDEFKKGGSPNTDKGGEW